MRTADPRAPAKIKILDTAESIMLAQGFTATSVEEICRKAGITNGSFFHFFSSKEELGKAALERFISRELEMLGAAPFRREHEPLARLFGWIDSAIEAFENPALPKSCLLGNLTQELAATHPEFQALCSKLFTRWAEGFAADAAAAIKRHPPAYDVNPFSLADHFLAAIQGSLILIKGKRDASIGAKNMRHLRNYVEALFAARKRGKSTATAGKRTHREEK